MVITKYAVYSNCLGGIKKYAEYFRIPEKNLSNLVDPFFVGKISVPISWIPVVIFPKMFFTLLSKSSKRGQKLGKLRSKRGFLVHCLRRIIFVGKLS